LVTAARSPQSAMTERVTCLGKEGKEEARAGYPDPDPDLDPNPNTITDPNPDLGEEGVQRGVEGVEGQAGLAGVLPQRQRVELEEHLVRVTRCRRLMRRQQQSG